VVLVTATTVAVPLAERLRLLARLVVPPAVAAAAVMIGGRADRRTVSPR
jgi:hypothetical protein